MNTQQTIDTFTDFFRQRDHRLIPGHSLVSSPGDPVLFISAGMHPLTPYLEGRPHPDGRRLVSVQRCLRTTDLDEVGDPTHLTVFQMLGSWSLGDYSGEQSVRWGYDLVTGGFGISPGRLHATVFSGDQQVAPDTVLLETWQHLGVPVELTADNWWSNGPAGLCGPDSELFVWTGDADPQGTPSTDERWMELWNHVLMRYRRLGDGRLQPLPQPNVDTGLGLERLLMVVQGTDSVYGTDLLEPWVTTVRRLWQPGELELRLLTDHLRSACVVIGDGVRPSNTGRGYVLRRLIRRVLTVLWRDDPDRTLGDLPPDLLRGTLGPFGCGRNEHHIRPLLLDEERRFRELLERGRGVLSRLRPPGSEPGPLTEEEYRYLHETHGLPRELVSAMLSEPVPRCSPVDPV